MCEMEALAVRESAVQFISPDTSYHIFWRFVSKRKRFGAMGMVKWRSFGVGVEWFRFNWLGIFVGPFCFAFGRVELAEPAASLRATRKDS